MMTTGDRLNEYHRLLDEEGPESAREFLTKHQEDRRFVSLIEHGDAFLAVFDALLDEAEERVKQKTEKDR